MAFRLVFSVFLLNLYFITVICSYGSYERVKLRDVEVITLYQDRNTNARRSHPVPHLKCMGGTAGCHEFIPKVVQCYNRGFDGYDVQWECKTEMDKAFKFGRIQVSCEGFDYPDDPYILKGSCGLEYTIDYVNGGKSNTHSNKEQDDYGYSKPSTMSNLIAIAIIALVCFAIYRTCIANNQYSPSNDDYPDQNRRDNRFGSSGAPPSPGFRPEYYSGDSCSGNQRSAGNSSGGGFWTGAATGGLLGYVFGSRGNSSNYGTGYGGGYSRRPSWGSGWGTGGGGSTSSRTEETRTTSGFGGTTRR